MSEVREIREDELVEIQSLETELVGHDNSLQDIQERFNEIPETFIAYFEDEKLIGFAAGRMEGEKMGLESIGVKENYRNQGIGSKLFSVFEKKAKKYSNTVTIASASSTEQFYKSNGYKPVKIMLQVKKKNLPENYSEMKRIVDEKKIDEETKFPYADFDEYSKKLRDKQKEELNAFEVNTIYKKRI